MAGLYIHVPFCASRCVYCGFYSILTPKPTTRGKGKNIIDRYVDALCRELELRKEYIFNFNTNNEKDTKLQTIYFGGGTPSQLSFRHIEQIFKCIQTVYGNHITSFGDMEITFECNPDDITEEFANNLKHLPINRISMGAQTFSDERLKFLRRRHKANDVKTAISRLRNAGIRNISIDLMFGFPDETLEDWQEDVREALALSVEHISAYSLMYEEGTPLYRLLEEGKVKDMDDELYRTMYDALIDSLSAKGYEQYEISNFAKLTDGDTSAFRSKHNSSYWQNKPYLGIGASAHSYNLQTRQWNVSNLQKYIESIETGKLKQETEIIDADTHFNDLITTTLRTREGINISALSSQYKAHILHTAQPFIAQKLLVLDGNYLHFTRDGIYVSDNIMAELMYV